MRIEKEKSEAFSYKSVFQIFFLFLNQNICCGYSIDPPQCDSSFEYPKHMLKLIGKKKNYNFMLKNVVGF